VVRGPGHRPGAQGPPWQDRAGLGALQETGWSGAVALGANAL